MKAVQPAHPARMQPASSTAVVVGQPFRGLSTRPAFCRPQRTQPARTTSAVSVWAQTHGVLFGRLASGRCRAAALTQVAEVAANPTAQAVEPAQAVFSWTAHWWPVQAIENINPTIPEHVDLLGKSLVVWGDGQGHWHCLEDKCPHRLAPLSEGRVEQGQIMCCYHGWTFSGTGACTGIPQLAGDSKAHASACNSKRSCVAAYPTRVHNGLLWIWPESGEQAAQQAASQEPEGMKGGRGYSTWYVRDLPVRWDTLLENVLDGSHVPFAHHGIQGNRNSGKNSPWNSVTLGSSETGGFMASSGQIARFDGASMVACFEPPFYACYKVKGELAFGPQSAIVPTKPGWSRLIANFSTDVSFFPPLLKLMIKARLGVVFDQHIGASAVLDGDTHLLHIAERLLPVSKGIGFDTAAQQYYLPSSADTSTIALRKWLQQYGPAPTCTPADEASMPAEMSKEQVLDRYNQHTKNCSHCRNALATLDKVQRLTMVLGLAAAVAFVAQAIATSAVAHVAAPIAATTASTAPAALPGLLMAGWQAVQAAGLQQTLLASGVLALLCLGMHRFLAKYREGFIYKGYVHALMD